jgi:pimeloyl-ACP methyl ester carboxylesterase
VVFSHGWPLSSDSWEAQMVFLASRGDQLNADLPAFLNT